MAEVIEPGRSRIEDILLNEEDIEPGRSRIEDILLSLYQDLVHLDDQGLIPTEYIPPQVFERMVTVANDTERFALTTDDVQNGDWVYVNSTQIMYFVSDEDHLDTEAGYTPVAAGIAAKAVADKDGNQIDTTYQTIIDSNNMLSADLVDDTSATNKFTNATEKQTWNGKQDALTFDPSPTENSTNPVTSGGVYTALSGKQATIDSSHKLSSDLVDDTNNTHKFATQAQLNQISTNQNNISSLQKEVDNVNLIKYTLADLKALNTTGTWSGNVYTVSNLTFTVNADMSITVDGTNDSGANIAFIITNKTTTIKNISAGIYYLSGSPDFDGSYNYFIFAYNGKTTTPTASYYNYSGYTECAIDYTNADAVNPNIAINVRTGTTLTKLFKPMLSVSEVAYAPYRPSLDELYQMIQALQ